MIKILVYGAGPLGSVFAARLQAGGNDVSILARGRRLADLREHGIVLHDVRTDQWTTSRVKVVEELASHDVYDLVLVIMRKNHAIEILPILAANTQTPNVLFLMNNVAGPGQLVEALGKERVLIGFLATAGYRDGHVVHCVAGTEEEPMPVLFGEVDGRSTGRTQRVARALDSAPGYSAEVRTDMDTWLKYHVALIIPSIAPALYAAGGDSLRLAHTRDLLVLGIRAIREGFQVLRALGLPVTPAKFKAFDWMPEPLLLRFAQRFLTGEYIDIALVRHAMAAPDEMKYHTDEFLALARTTPVATPNIDCLYRYFTPETPLVPEGSADIPLLWGGTAALVGGLTALLAGAGTLIMWTRRRRRR